LVKPKFEKMGGVRFENYSKFLRNSGIKKGEIETIF